MFVYRGVLGVPGNGVGVPGAGVTGSWEPPKLGVENELTSSAREGYALNCPATFLAPFCCKFLFVCLRTSWPPARYVVGDHGIPSDILVLRLSNLCSVYYKHGNCGVLNRIGPHRLLCLNAGP